MCSPRLSVPSVYDFWQVSHAVIPAPTLLLSVGACLPPCLTPNVTCPQDENLAPSATSVCTMPKDVITCKELVKRLKRTPAKVTLPLVRHLVMEAHFDSTEDLRDLDQVLPNHSQLTITTRGPNSKAHLQVHTGCVQHSVSECCLALRQCTNARILQLDLTHNKGWVGPQVVLEGSECHFDQLPPSLTDLRSNVRTDGLLNISGFMSRVRALTVTSNGFPCNSLPELLKLVPLLQEFTLSGYVPIELMWNGKSTSTVELCKFKNRLLGGFQLDCDSVFLSGPIEHVHALMTWLRPLRSTTSCEIDLDGTVRDPMCFEPLARVCPVLRQLSLRDESSCCIPVTDAAVLTPLLGISKLEILELQMNLAFTSTSLFDFCASMPALTNLRCTPIDGFSLGDVMAELIFEGHAVKIN